MTAAQGSSLADYQRALIGLLFSSDPEPHVARLGGREDRWRAYRRMVRGRLAASIEHAYPRLRALVASRWEPMLDAYFAAAPPRSPYLRDVAGEVLAWLERDHFLQSSAQASAPMDVSPGDEALPPWALDLARHEWALCDCAYVGEEEGARASVVALTMDRPAVLSPAHRSLRTRWSVHRFGADGDRSSVVAGDFALCIYRDPSTHDVRVLELEPLAAALLEEVDRGERPLVEAVRAVAQRAGAPIDGAFVAALSDLIADLVERGLWLGSAPSTPPSET